jgi:hypothetical protein
MKYRIALWLLYNWLLFWHFLWRVFTFLILSIVQGFAVCFEGLIHGLGQPLPVP